MRLIKKLHVTFLQHVKYVRWIIVSVTSVNISWTTCENVCKINHSRFLYFLAFTRDPLSMGAKLYVAGTAKAVPL